MEINKKYLINLQLFADGDTGEKTEPATPRKREESRKKGQVFKSSDLNAAFMLIVGSVAIFLSFETMVFLTGDFLKLYLIERTSLELNNDDVINLGREVIFFLGKILFPIFLATFIAALLMNYLQVGFIFSGDPITPKLEKLNPIEGFKKIFSKRALVELSKSIAKISITGTIVYTVIMKYLYIFPRLVDMELGATISQMSLIVFELAMKVGLFFIIIGIIDYLYQQYEYENSLKMSKHEVKQEYKQVEGDPLIKSKQRQIQREAAMKRMMAEVPSADVVITNPIHFAVALKYQSESMEAPTIIAKGQDFMALKIRKIAEENDILVVENPSLARMLYHNTEIGDFVPEDLYQAVAEVLAFVYKQKKIVY